MYERTPLSRGESLDPNPLGQGEYIEHKHKPIICNSGLHSFRMLNVGFFLQHSPQHSHTIDIVVFIYSTSIPHLSMVSVFRKPRQIHVQ